MNFNTDSSLNQSTAATLLAQDSTTQVTALALLDEDGLPNGIPGGPQDAAGQDTVAIGTLGYNFGANGPAATHPFRWETTGLPSLTSGGEALSYQVSTSGRTLSASTSDGTTLLQVRLTDLASGSYSISLLGPIDHPDATIENNLIFSVYYTITDGDGDSATARLGVDIDDDSPTTTVIAPSSLEAGDTVTGTWSQQGGADGVADTVVNLQADDNEYPLGTPIDTGKGILTVNPNGTWSFSADNDASGALDFNITTKDGDGDSFSSSAHIVISGGNGIGPTTPETDGNSATVSPKAVVDEDGLPGGIAGGINDYPGERTIATGRLRYNFGDDGPGGFTWSTAGLPVLTSQGSLVSWALSADGRSLLGTSASGQQVLSIELSDLAAGTYRVDLFKPLDHPRADVESDINFSVGYTITDGDSAQGILRVTVDDDMPVPGDDTAAGDNSGPITVDVLDNDNFGADGPGELTSVTVQGGPDVGTATINPDGTLTFVPNPGFTGNATIDYTATDGDGSTVTGNLSVGVADGGGTGTGPTTPETDGNPDTTPPKAVLDEDGLPGGIAGGINDVVGERLAAIGSLGYDFGSDGRGSFTWNTAGLPVLTSGGSPVTWSLSGNGRSLVGFNNAGERVISVQLTDVANGIYKVVLAKPLDHSNPSVESDINFSVGYTITDGVGDSASGTIGITVDDDTPVTNADVATTDNDGSVTVDVLGNDQFGADGPGGITNATVQGGAGVGTVTVNPDGTLTFVPHPNFVGNANINYTATDGDGSAVNGSLSVQVNDGGTGPTTPETDGNPHTTPPKAVLDEDGLPGGIAGGINDVAGERTAAVGSLGYDFGSDGPGSFSWHTAGLPVLTSGGSPVTWSLSGNGRSLVGFDNTGNRVISVQLTDVANGIYKVVLAKPLDHSNPSVESDINFSVGYTITDSVGDSASGTIGITVDDDTPVANADIATTDNHGSVTVDVLGNDQFGADGPGGITNATVQGGAGVGSVAVNPDGTLTFTPNPGFVGNATIDYTATDGDGSAVDGSLNVAVADGGTGPTTPDSDGDPSTSAPTAVVDEDGLPGGIAGGIGDVPGEPTVATGSLGYSFGSDGPGSFSWSTAGLPVLTSGGSPVNWSLSANGLSLFGTDSNGNSVISVQLTNIVSGAYKVILAKPLDHSNPNIESDIDFSVGYTITDSAGDSASGSIDITVDDDMPVTNADVATTDNDGSVTVDVLGNDQFGADGSDGITNATVQGGAAVGTVAVNPDGTLTFTPNTDFVGNATIDYTATDGDGSTVGGSLSVAVGDGGTGPTTPETDGNPNTTPPKAVLDEDGLPGGIAGGINDVAGERTAATGSLGYDFGSDGPGSFSWNTAGLPALTSGGSPVTWSLSGNGRSLVGFDNTGSRVISVQLTDVANGNYKVVLAKPLDHSNPGVESDINFSVGYTITDSVGDSASGSIGITVDDDTPVANADSATTDNDGTVTVDVLGNDQFGADGQGALTGATVQGGATVGTVAVNPDGSLTFTPNPGFVGNATIDYIATDGDGSTVGGSLNVAVADGGTDPTTPDSDGDPNTNAPNAVVDEDGLPGGIAGGIGDVPGERTVATGSLGYSFGSDGPGSFAWSAAGLPALTSGGSPVTWSISANGLSLFGTDSNGNSVISVQVTNVANGSYRVVLSRPLDHSSPNVESDIDFSVGYTITDSVGNSASGSIDVTIDDDMPVANADSATTDNDGSVTVDVLGNDQFGADGLGDITNATVQGGAAVGTVAVNPDGTLTFTPNAGFTGNATIDYTATDGDGSAISGNLNVAVADGGTDPTTPDSDGDPNTNAPNAVVDEDGLPGGIAGGVGDVPGERTVATGSLGYSFGSDGPGSFAWSTAGLPALTSGGSPVTWSISANGLSLFGTDSNGNSVISVQVTNVANGSYRVVLSRPLDHSSPNVETDIDFSLGYTITDSVGNSASGSIDVTVDDDMPVANADSATTDNDGTVTVDVLGNDQFGADGSGDITNATVQGGAAVGTVAVNPDGTLTFTPNPGFVGNATINYTATDGDGSAVSGNLSVAVADGGTEPTTPETEGSAPVVAVVDEDGLPGGNAGGNGDVAGTAVVVTGLLGYSFGDDGPAAGGGFAWGSDTSGLPAQTSDGQDIRYFLSSNALSLVGLDQAGNRVIAIDILNTATGQYRVVLSQPLDHPIAGTEDDLRFNVSYTITDSDGDTAQGNLVVVVDDDSPRTSAVQVGQLTDGATADISFFGADGAGSLTFGSALAGTQVTSPSGLPVRTSNGDTLTYQLSGNGLTLKATTAGGFVAFEVTLASDGSSYSVNVFDDGIGPIGQSSLNLSDATKEVLIPYQFQGGSGFGSRYLAYENGDVAPDVVVSAWSVDDGGSRASYLRSEANGVVAVGSDNLTGENEIIRIDFVDDLAFSSNRPNWEDHRGVTFFSDVMMRAERMEFPMLAIKAFGLAPDGNATSGHPYEAGQENVLSLSRGDIRFFDTAGRDITSRLDITELDDGSLRIKNIPSTARFEITTDQPFEALEFKGLHDWYAFSLSGDFEYSWLEKGDLGGGNGGALTLPVQGADGDGDRVNGNLELALPSSGSNTRIASARSLDTGNSDDGDGEIWAGVGADTIVFLSGDEGTSTNPSMDVVNNFTLGDTATNADADTLDLSDLLHDASEEDVSEYLHASQDGDNTVLSVKSDGGIGASGAGADQVITLTNVHMAGASSDSFLNQLVQDGQLDVE
ncbi:Ig-like domain-containing protein [Halomonas sp. H33-56]|uniref:Ig-like domain-containing protein n=1 Tax=Halomonas sp. H33-56 TaxID=2950873 RepID=UPI0032DEAD28